MGTKIVDLVLPSTVTFAQRSKSPTRQINGSKLNTSAFYECTNLTSVAMPANVKGISMFYNNSSLTNITFEEGLSEISKNMFSGRDLRKVGIPSSVVSVSSAAFSGNVKCAAVKNASCRQDGMVFSTTLANILIGDDQSCF